MINVTKTFFPPIEEYQKQIERIWKNEWLTNRGELVLELESKLKDYLEISNITLMNNGTIPIQIALKILGERGEIITTPFSYVATTSAIVWESCTPVFVDIHPDYLTIDETKIEEAITSKTKAILAVHVFGNPCNVAVIEKIAKKHGLYVIYDAAHSFGTTYKNKSVFEYGDVSTCSFHATKIFHTGEGGALFCKDEELNKKLYYSHNFGHKTATTFYGLGINGKISEINAAMGLAVLPHMEHIIAKRKEVVDYYNEHLSFLNYKTIKIRKGTQWNYSYYPVIFGTEEKLLQVMTLLNSNNIKPRRYFHPSLNTLDYVASINMPISESIAERTLCLPLYAGLIKSELELICNLINNVSIKN
ncbi:DegT/DnrJ/EryC1/StrS family aminotransferase [Lacinutrix undariae]